MRETEFAPIDDERHEQANGRSNRKARILPGVDYADMSTVSQKQWLVHHLLAVSELSAFYGEPGSGKSVLAQDIGLHLAAGLPWFGREVRQSAVLYVALERAAVVARRALAFGIEHDMVAERLPFRMVRGPLDFRDPNVAAEIVGSLADLARRYRLRCGPADRRHCEPRTMRRRRKLAERHGRADREPRPHPGHVDIHLLLTHHQPAEKERMRGHGALLGAVDTTVHIVKTTAGRLAEVVKCSDHEEGQRVAFFLKGVTVGTDEQGDPITAPVVIEDMAGVAPKKKAAMPNGARVAINALEEAIGDLGVIPPVSNHIPPATKAVTTDQWRDYAYRRGISGSKEPRARQQAFDRALKQLQAARAVGIWEPYAWIA